jgi:hypothetical protein
MTCTTLLLTLLVSTTPTQGEPPVPTEADCPAHALYTRESRDHLGAVNVRGDEAMGFSHRATSHHFLLTGTGGVIAVSATDPTDLVSADAIRAHLLHIARVFALGDFSIPGQVHARIPPGVPVMKQQRAAIRYTFEPTAQGGRVVIATKDGKALEAVHAFLRFQITDHRTGDATSVGP